MEKMTVTQPNTPLQENPNDLFYYTDKNGRSKRSENFDAKREKLMTDWKKNR